MVCMFVLLVTTFRALHRGMEPEGAELGRRVEGFAPASNLSLLPLIVFVMAFAWYGGIGLVMAKLPFLTTQRRLFRPVSIASGMALILLAGTMLLAD